MAYTKNHGRGNRQSPAHLSRRNRPQATDPNALLVACRNP